MTETRLVSILAASYYWPGAEYEDVAQEARYALERARQRWSPDKGCAWLSFAWMCVKRHLIEQVRRETRRRPQFAELLDSVPDRTDVVELVAAREHLRAILATPLSDLERVALGQIIRGGKCPKGRLDNALWRAKRKVAT